MVDVVLLGALLLIVIGVLGSFIPLVPSGLSALAGIWTYALFGADPIGPIVLTVLTLTAIVTALLEHLGGPLAAKLSGSSNEVMVASTVGGLVLMFVLGPLGIIVGVVGVVFLLELKGGADVALAGRRSVFTAIGVLASSVAQLLFTLSILGMFVLFVVVL